MNYEILLTFILASAALAISPGPDNIYVLMQSIVNGKKYGIATALGLVSGCLVHTTLLAFGVSVLIKEKELINKMTIIDLIILSKLENSKSEIRRLIKGNGIRINNQVISDEKLIVTKDLFQDNLIKLSLGKKRHIKVELN